MKHAVRAIVLGAILSGSVNAAEQSTAGQPALSKDLAVKATSEVTRKNKHLRSRKAQSAGKPVGKKAGSKAQNKLDNVTGTPPEAIDESVQIKGVRG